ncbi:heparan-alpha-glucosaminide N-acetyltransferase [Nitratireductor luteus]|uniref:heparan-alpha-glucosaminide N-acetyltransferase n=1 Tax=Nitratireductor luteus TaxID=2976980 RepID=UPI003B8463B6
MAIYHFTWDLEFFGYLQPFTSVTGGWKLFARCIASSFLFLVGVSLVLAHARSFKAGPFAKRLVMIAGAAAAISLVTWLLMPEQFIFFGILHHIAVASVLGLLLLHFPATLLAALAVLVVAAPHYVHWPFLDQPVLWWIGLSRNVPASNDYIPIFPWFGAVLSGMAAAKVAQSTGFIDRLAAWRPGLRIPVLGWAGRHSLAFYLVHQPVLISCVWIMAQLYPPSLDAADVEAGFMRMCTNQCVQSREQALCESYCGCIVEEARAAERTQVLARGAEDEEATRWVQDTIAFCARSQ